jgi:hypothetical protein
MSSIIISWSITDSLKASKLILLYKSLNQKVEVIDVPAGHAAPQFDQAEPVLELDTEPERSGLILK